MSRLASQLAALERAEFQFEREDWTLFRNVDTLSQKAGVPKSKLRRLVLKELADNALDCGASVVTLEAQDLDTFTIADDGPGIAGEPNDIARLFSINRPLLSSKLWRVPSRGAMGNGLRVVVGAVAASDGRLVVVTCNRRYTLVPNEDGSTRIVEMEAVEDSEGTRITIGFGLAVPQDHGASAWADAAIGLAQGGSTYAGKPSPWWYDADAFYELMRSAGGRPIREVVEQLDGCSGAKAGAIAKAVRGMPCHAVTRDQALALLTIARKEAKPVRPERLGEIGRLGRLPGAYACKRGIAAIGGREPMARIPYVVEVWVQAAPRGRGGDEVDVATFVNRTPIVAEIEAWRSGGKISVTGCGLSHRFDAPPGCYAVTLNITTPWCPITTDGKEPNLAPFIGEIAMAVQTATRKAKTALPKVATSGRLTHKDIVLHHLDEAVNKASGGGMYRFNQRQLFYVLRPTVLRYSAKELGWPNFQQIITDREAVAGDIVGMYRDPRGTLYHPHLGQDISLGTLAVEEYQRPAWTFGQIVYLEKEGFFEALKATRWPERHDCALVTSKGFTTRAVRDLLDLLGDDGEPIRVFCVHDADAFGTMIFQTLQEETKARARRRVDVVNLGLDPWEAIAMELEPEAVEPGDRSRAVADYVLDRKDGYQWQRWLQTNRVELNEMTTAALIAWLDRKLAEHGIGKVIPPPTVIAVEAERQLANQVRSIVTERVLREAKVEEQVAGVVADLDLPAPDVLTAVIADWIGEHESEAWSDGVADLVEDVASTVPR